MPTETQTRLQGAVQRIAREISHGLNTDENGVYLAGWARDWVEANSEEIEASEPSAMDWLQDVLDWEYVITRSNEYKAARILVCFGGPNIWVNTLTKTVDGYWWGEEAHASFDDELGLDEALEELYQS